MKIKIIDSIMGSGKTSAAINYMNKDYQKKFIYITPYLDEVDRVISACNEERDFGLCSYMDDKGNCVTEESIINGFYQPDLSKGSKKRTLKSLIKKEKCIATTHSMFNQFDDEIMELIASKGYELILDEAANVVSPYGELKKSDKDILFNNFLRVGDKGIVEWIDNDYDGKFNEVKHLCDLGSLCCYGEKTLMLWLMPIKAFACFDKVTILTYMFEGQLQKYYYDLYDVGYDYGIACKDENGNYIFKDIDVPPETKLDKSLFDILEAEKINRIGVGERFLSKGWYERAKKNGNISCLKVNCENYINNITKSKSDEVAWTTFKDYKNDTKGKGYTKGFIPSNMRASNAYRSKDVGMYLVNKYVNPIIVNFFGLYDVHINQDAYALSEMLQWIWRLAIRDGKPIKLYIPSKRMRTLLTNWLETGEISSK